MNAKLYNTCGIPDSEGGRGVLAGLPIWVPLVQAKAALRPGVGVGGEGELSHLLALHVP